MSLCAATSASDPKRTLAPSRVLRQFATITSLASGEPMRRRQFITLLGGALISWPLASRAQQAEKISRVGFLGPARTPAQMEFYRAFSSQLEKNGFREGENILVEYRAIDDPRGPFIGAAELVRSNPACWSPLVPKLLCRLS